MAEFPLYPPLDLARLVLGYLEEEECTTAYEEFIKSSPYLEEFRTNYNNAILSNFSLKSLKDVFGEYCAYKAYIRNCKIPGLRTRLLQCKTLLDTAQLFIANIDQNKVINGEDSSLHAGINTSQAAKQKHCNVCKETTLKPCVCGTRASVPALSTTFSHMSRDSTVSVPTSSPSSVETTQLADLPGTSDTTKRRQDAAHIMHQSVRLEPQIEVSSAPTRTLDLVESHVAKTSVSAEGQSVNNLSVKTNELMDCSEDIRQILNIVNQGANQTCQVVPPTERNQSNNKKFSATEKSFQEFVSGVNSGDVKLCTAEAMPDSSTPESNLSQNNQTITGHRGNIQTISIQPGISGFNLMPKCTSTFPTLQSDVYKKTYHSSDETDASRDSTTSVGYMATHKNSSVSQRSDNSTKSTCSKVTILSNDLVKSSKEDGTIVINRGGTKTTLRPLVGKPVALKGIKPRSSSIIQINGMQVYQNDNNVRNSRLFTKEEIMSMPTVIVLQPSTSAQTDSSIETPCYTMSSTASSVTSCLIKNDYEYKSLEPICMDPIFPSNAQNNLPQLGEVPTVKETVSLEKTSTPNKPLLVKKASSTPRRGSSSHVRVLDFNAPRQLTVKKPKSQEKPASPVVVSNVVSQTSTSVQYSQLEKIIETVDTTVDTNTKVTPAVIGSNVKKIKADWDADLRQCFSTPFVDNNVNKTKPKRIKTPIKRPRVHKQKISKPRVTKSTKKDKVKNETKTTTVEDCKEESQTKSNLKPTINLIKDWKESPKVPPANERDPLEIIIPDDIPKPGYTNTHNQITSKQNNDFLMQTPYKTMMETLNMDTPRFIDPSVFDVPMSDIKIDSIPTPHFLNTPNFLLSGGKAMQGTPSSYSSRPTDYSSGGSYYRPDEHEFDPLIEFKPKQQQQILNIPSSSKEDSVKINKKKSQKESVSLDSKESVSNRPRRQCTLKVSYCELSGVKNNKDSSQLKASNRLSRTPSPNSSSSSSESEDSEGSVKENKINKSQDLLDKEVLDELEKKRKRIIESLKKKTPVKSKIKRNSGSLKKSTIDKKVKPVKKTLTVAELKKSMGPRKMPNVSGEKSRKKSIGKDSLHFVSAAPVSTKSRRKSSTPRKVDKFIVHNIEDSISAEIAHKKQEAEMTEEELPPLRVSSDDCSQDSRPRKTPIKDETETDDIVQIKAYIETTSNKMEPTVQELVQRGFDLETAKSIERDLLGTPVPEYRDSKEPGKVIVDLREGTKKCSEIIVTIEESPSHNFDCSQREESTNEEIHNSTVVNRESSSISLNQEIHNSTVVNKESSSISVEEKNDSAIILQDDIILVRETFDEKSKNYFFCEYTDESMKTNETREPLDEKFGFDIQCDDITIRVCLEKFEILYDHPPQTLEDKEGDQQSVLDSTRSSSSSSSDSEKEPDLEAVKAVEAIKAVESISYLPPLYTPLKDYPSTTADLSNSEHNTSLQRQCLEIFDSTLNSLDTPVKSNSFSKSADTSTSLPLADDERAQESWNINTKRKKPSSSPVPESSTKKSKSDHQILMQNIDIESLLTKLHGENT